MRGILPMANVLTIFSQRHGDSSNEIKTKPVGRVNVTGNARQPVDEKKPRGSRMGSVIARLRTAYSRKRACVRGKKKRKKKKKKSFRLSPPISNVYAKIERNVEHELPVNWPRIPFKRKFVAEYSSAL